MEQRSDVRIWSPSEGAPLWAQVATANTATLRAFLAAGQRALCAENLFGS